MLTDWELSSITAKWTAFSFVVKIGAGILPMEFTNKSTGGVAAFTASGFVAGFSAPVSWATGMYPSPWLTTRGRLMTTISAPSPFPISCLSRNYGVLMSWGGVTSSVGLLAFSYVPVTPMVHAAPLVAYSTFAFCFFTLPSTLYGSLSGGPFTFRVR